MRSSKGGEALSRAEVSGRKLQSAKTISCRHVHNFKIVGHDAFQMLHRAGIERREFKSPDWDQVQGDRHATKIARSKTKRSQECRRRCNPVQNLIVGLKGIAHAGIQTGIELKPRVLDSDTAAVTRCSNLDPLIGESASLPAASKSRAELAGEDEGEAAISIRKTAAMP